MAPPTSNTAIEAHRPAIEGLAYRMLGTWADAQDIAQESLLKWYALADPARDSIRLAPSPFQNPAHQSGLLKKAITPPLITS